jgi:hypothetical protein
MSRLCTFGLLVGALLLCSCSVEHTQRAQEGQPILRAIYQYAQDTGSYPTSLAVLAPKYLPVAPVEDWKRGWHYGPADSRGITNGFILSRWSTGYKTRVEYVDDGTTAGWRVNAEGDKIPLNLPSMKKASKRSLERTAAPPLRSRLGGNSGAPRALHRPSRRLSLSSVVSPLRTRT